MSDNYWEKRAVDLEKLTQDGADVDIMHVNKLFDSAVEIIEKQIEEIFGKYARDSGMSPDVALRLLNEDQTDTLRRNLMITLAQCQEEVARQAILARLNAPAYAARISRLEALKDLVYSQAYMVGADAHRRLKNRLIDTYGESYYRSIYDMQRRAETGFDFTKLADRDVQAAIETEWAGSNYSKRIWKNTDKLAKSLEQVITQGLMTGQSIRDMDLALEAKIDGGRYNINRVIRTEVNNCCNQGTLKSYKEAGVLRYIYLATLDLRTSSICRKLDKEVFFVSKAEQGVNFPPMHPHCRSTTMEYREDLPKERIARDPKTGENIYVPFEMSYAQWYRKYVLEREESKNVPQSKEVKSYADVTDKWKQEATPNSHEITESETYTYNDVTYRVDGVNVQQNNSARELQVAALLKTQLGGDIKLIPEVKGKFSNVKTPDYLYRGERWDLKELSSQGKEGIRNAIHKKKGQADNFIIDISNNELPVSEIYSQAEKIFAFDNTKFVNRIMIISGKRILKIYERR